MTLWNRLKSYIFWGRNKEFRSSEGNMEEEHKPFNLRTHITEEMINQVLNDGFIMTNVPNEQEQQQEPIQPNGLVLTYGEQEIRIAPIQMNIHQRLGSPIRTMNLQFYLETADLHEILMDTRNERLHFHYQAEQGVFIEGEGYIREYNIQSFGEEGVISCDMTIELFPQVQLDHFYVDLAQDIMTLTGETGEPSVQMVQQINERFHRLASELDLTILQLRNVVQSNQIFRHRIVRVLNDMNEEALEYLRQMIVAIQPPVREWNTEEIRVRLDGNLDIQDNRIQIPTVQLERTEQQRLIDQQISLQNEYMQQQLRQIPLSYYTNQIIDHNNNPTIRMCRTGSPNVFLGALVTALEDPDIDLAADDEIILGVVTQEAYDPLDLSRDHDNPFPDNTPVHVCVSRGNIAWCWVNNQYMQLPLERVIGRTYNEVVQEFGRPMVPTLQPLQQEISEQLGISRKELFGSRVKQEFKINDLIILKLEVISSGNRARDSINPILETNIYIKGEKFRSCKYLLLNLEYGNEYEDIESIDDAAEKLGRNHPNRDMESRNTHIVSPEEEFQGHCSNLHAWVEYDYDIRILHSNLSIPLLRELSKYDSRARMRFKEQIIERLIKNGYKAFKMFKSDLKKFTNDEIHDLYQILQESNSSILHKLFIEKVGKPLNDPDLTEDMTF